MRGGYICYLYFLRIVQGKRVMYMIQMILQLRSVQPLRCKEDCETSRWFKHEKGICNKVKKELILGGR